jgi:hypothetical protein
MTEIERIHINKAGEIPPGLHWLYVIRLNGNSLSRIVEIMTVISSQSSICWPDDDNWYNLLPSWFLTTLRQYSPEEARELLKSIPREKWSEIPWEFGSWLDAVKERGWNWWSIEVSGDYAKIRLSILNWPANLEAFEHILLASGAFIVSRFEELQSNSENNLPHP